MKYIAFITAIGSNHNKQCKMFAKRKLSHNLSKSVCKRRPFHRARHERQGADVCPQKGSHEPLSDYRSQRPTSNDDNDALCLFLECSRYDRSIIHRCTDNYHSRYRVEYILLPYHIYYVSHVIWTKKYDDFNTDMSSSEHFC